jgi:hypothetical protein
MMSARWSYVTLIEFPHAARPTTSSSNKTRHKQPTLPIASPKAQMHRPKLRTTSPKLESTNKNHSNSTTCQKHHHNAHQELKFTSCHIRHITFNPKIKNQRELRLKPRSSQQFQEQIYLTSTILWFSRLLENAGDWCEESTCLVLGILYSSSAHGLRHGVLWLRHGGWHRRHGHSGVERKEECESDGGCLRIHGTRVGNYAICREMGAIREGKLEKESWMMLLRLRITTDTRRCRNWQRPNFAIAPRVAILVVVEASELKPVPKTVTASEGDTIYQKLTVSTLKSTISMDNVESDGLWYALPKRFASVWNENLKPSLCRKPALIMAIIDFGNL